jgi:RNA polymerase sigma-70 factor (family 1)
VKRSGVPNEKVLLTLVAAGDEQAFKDLFNHYGHHLGSYICRLVGSFEASQEIIQDVFLKVWLQRSQLPMVQHFEGWLFIIAKNYTLNYLHKQAREASKRNQFEKDISSQPAIIDVDENPNPYMDRLEKVVEKLPSQQRKVYLLSRRHGLKLNLIAEKLGISEATVKKHQARALQAIRKNLSLF